MLTRGIGNPQKYFGDRLEFIKKNGGLAALFRRLGVPDGDQNNVRRTLEHRREGRSKPDVICVMAINFLVSVARDEDFPIQRYKDLVGMVFPDSKGTMERSFTSEWALMNGLYLAENGFTQKLFESLPLEEDATA